MVSFGLKINWQFLFYSKTSLEYFLHLREGERNRGDNAVDPSVHTRVLMRFIKRFHSFSHGGEIPDKFRVSTHTCFPKKFGPHVLRKIALSQTRKEEAEKTMNGEKGVRSNQHCFNTKQSLIVSGELTLTWHLFDFFFIRQIPLSQIKQLRHEHEI